MSAHVWAVMWINPRSQRRVRWFDNFNVAINFRAHLVEEGMPFYRTAVFECLDRIGL